MHTHVCKYYSVVPYVCVKCTMDFLMINNANFESEYSTYVCTYVHTYVRMDIQMSVFQMKYTHMYIVCTYIQ